jgi:hypothetical protein
MFMVVPAPALRPVFMAMVVMVMMVAVLVLA